MSATINALRFPAASSSAASSSVESSTALGHAATIEGVSGVQVSGVQVSAKSHLRITRRGRLALTIAVVAAALAIVAAFLLTGGNAVASSTPGNVHFEHVTVSAGETLWQVAEGVAPDSDPRDVISDIVKLNDLSTTQVMPGQSLAIPLAYSQS